MNSSIRLLALDLDDTLLRSDLTISFRTRNIIKKAEAAGFVIVLASGRFPRAMEKIARSLGMHKRPGYLICNNGTFILESHTGKVVFEKKLPAETALIAYDLADAEGFPLQIYEDDVMYISRSNEYADYDQKLTGFRQVVVENFRAMVKDGCYKLLIPGDPMILKPLESMLKTYLGGQATIFTSKPFFLEILPPDTDKGTALEKVASAMGLKQEEVMAIGDSMNDEAMLRWAGIPVAMINGDQRIKKIARIVSWKSNDEDGVADIIERFILKSEAIPEKIDPGVLP